MSRLASRLLRTLSAAALAALAATASAAEVSVFSGGAVRLALDAAAARYERLTANHVTADYAPVGTLMGRLEAGAQADVVVLTTDVLPEAGRRGWVLPDSATVLGGIGVGVAVREGAAVPDISTPEALKRTLLAARSITYIDPQKGTSGKHFAAVLQRLGIAEAVKGKTVLASAGYVVEPVARGEVELGIQQITEILPVKGVKLVGPLPEPLQKITEYTAALTPRGQESAAARGFLAYLRSGECRGIFKDKGFRVP